MREEHVESYTETYSRSAAGGVAWWPNMHHAATGGPRGVGEEWTRDWIQDEPIFVILPNMRKLGLSFRIVL